MHGGKSMSLLDGFERWDRRSAPRIDVPLVTVQQGGLFSLNKAAFEGMGSPKKVELFYNPQTKVVAFAPTDDNNLNGYPPRQQGSQANFYVAGQKFTKFHDIDTSVARRYAAKIEQGILFLDLRGPSTIATGVRARAQQRNENDGRQSALALGNKRE